MITILGAGVSGLSLGYHLAKKKIICKIFEKEDTSGGLARSFLQDGFGFDYTGHLLTLQNSYTKKLVAGFLKNNLKFYRRNATIYLNNNYISYPFQSNLRFLPPKLLKECLLGFIRTYQFKKIKNMNFYNWVLATFGTGISKHFFIPYNQKLFRTNLKELTCNWISNFVPQPSAEEIFKNIFEYTNQRFGYNSSFAYPVRGGIQILADSLAEQQDINLNCLVTKISPGKKRVEINNRYDVEYRTLVSTLPLPVFMNLFEKLPHQVQKAVDNLKWSSVLCINLGIGRPNISPYHWIYIPENKYLIYRVGFYTNFSLLAPNNTSSLYAEVSYTPDKEIEILRNKNNIVKRVIKDLIAMNILKKNDKILTTNILNIPYGYVIFNYKREKSLSVINMFLKEYNIYTTGRYGAWNYTTMEQNIFAGKKMAEFLIKMRGTD